MQIGLNLSTLFNNKPVTQSGQTSGTSQTSKTNTSSPTNTNNTSSSNVWNDAEVRNSNTSSVNASMSNLQLSDEVSRENLNNLHELELQYRDKIKDNTNSQDDITEQISSMEAELQEIDVDSLKEDLGNAEAEVNAATESYNTAKSNAKMAFLI